MSPTDPLAPLLYAVVGALLLLLCLQLWRLARRGGKRAGSNAFAVKIIQVEPRPISQAQALWETLTEREKQVARLVEEGAHDAEIARALSISPHTVNSHLKSIYRKMHVRSRTELARVIRDCVD